MDSINEVHIPLPPPIASGGEPSIPLSTAVVDFAIHVPIGQIMNVVRFLAGTCIYISGGTTWVVPGVWRFCALAKVRRRDQLTGGRGFNPEGLKGPVRPCSALKT
jgi:hypothetical protein